MFIRTESTPNPATLKFLPGATVMGAGRMADFPSAEDGARSPLAQALFETGEVARVFYGADFISITLKSAPWKTFKATALEILADYLSSDAPLISSMAHEDDDGADDSEVVIQIKDLLETRVRPALAQDGGDVVFRGFDEGAGVVYLQLRGACAGCPSSTRTLKDGIEKLLKHYVPEVNVVESV